MLNDHITSNDSRHNNVMKNKMLKKEKEKRKERNDEKLVTIKGKKMRKKLK